MNKPTGKLAFAYQSIANLEAKNAQLEAEVQRLEAEKDEQEVLTEHNGCGNGVQVDQLTVRMYRGDKVVMIRGTIGKAYTAKPEVDHE